MFLLPTFQRPGFDYATNFFPVTQSRKIDQKADVDRMGRGEGRSDSCDKPTPTEYSSVKVELSSLQFEHCAIGE